MYREEGDKYVRVETPKSFDRLVQNLEDGDSVLYQSINFTDDIRASINSNTSNNIASSKNPQKHPTSDRNNNTKSESIKLKNIDEEEENSEEIRQSIEVQNLSDKIRFLEEQIFNKEQLIIEKDFKIKSLKQELDEIKKTDRTKTPKPIHSNGSGSQTNLYQEKYESTLYEYNQLKEVLAREGQLTKAKPKVLRPVNPNKHI